MSSPKSNVNTSRVTRSNSQSGITLLDIKELLEKTKSETVKEMKVETNKIADSMKLILARLEHLERSNEELRKKNDDLEVELERLKIERQDELAAFADEVHQRSMRKKNLIITGVTESDGTVEARKREDEGFCKTLFAVLSSNVSFEGAVRVGNIRQGRSRLLKVHFRTMEDKLRILRSCKELRNHPEYKSIYINPDRTPLEQEVHKRLREELKMRRESGEDDLVLYKGKIMSRNDIKNFPRRF